MDKLTKKELKAPDQILLASRSFMGWLRSGATGIVVACIILFVVIVGVLFYLQVAAKNEGKAQYIYAQAKGYYENWTLTEEGKKPDLDAQTKLKAELEKLQKEYPNSKANGLAEGLRAQMAAHEKNWAAAADLYEKFVSALPSSEKDLGRLPLAQALENAGQSDKALEAYSRLSDSKNDFFASTGLLGKARVLRKTSKLDDARKAYEKFLEKFGSSPEAPMVRGLLAQTSVK